MAQVRLGRTVGREEIIETMAKRNASVSRQEIIVVLDLMRDVITDILLAGNSAVTDLFNVRMSPAAGLKRAVRKDARFERIRPHKPAPELDSVYDHGTQSSNSEVSPGQTAELKGINLDYDRADEAQGVFFVNKEAKTEVKAEVIHRMNGSLVAFRVPELVQGTYGLALRRGFGNDVREGRLQAEVSVN